MVPTPLFDFPIDREISHMTVSRVGQDVTLHIFEGGGPCLRHDQFAEEAAGIAPSASRCTRNSA